MHTIKARGRLIGKQLDLRSLGQAKRVAVQSLALPSGDKGLAVLFRYGAVVLFDVPIEEEGALLGSLSPLVSEGVDIMETEDLDIRIIPGVEEGFSGGILQIHEASTDRLQTVAEVLAQSMVLAEYEESIAATFDRVEPLAEEMKHRGTIKEEDFSFRYFQNIEGDIQLPQGFKPQRVTIKVVSRNRSSQDPLEKTFDWPERK